MGWDDVFDRLLEQREEARIVIGNAGMSMAAAVAASMAAAAAMTKIAREINHPRYSNDAPRSPKPGFKKGR